MDATIHTKATRFLACTVSGLMNVALSVATTADQVLCRKCVAAVISERIEVFVGDPREAVAWFRMCAVRTFCPGEGNRVLRTVLLRCLPKGRWWNTDRVEIWLDEPLGPGPDIDMSKWRAQMATLISAALIWRPFKPYPRHRWKGAGEAVCDIGLPSVFHDVLTPAFVRFASVKLGQVAVGRIVAQSSRRGLNEDAGVFQAPIADACAEGGVTTAGSDATDQPPIEDGERGQRAKTHAKFLQNALGWLSLPAPSVRGQTLILRNVMVVLQRLLDCHLHLGSIRWENEQRARCARASAGGLPDGAQRPLGISESQWQREAQRRHQHCNSCDSYCAARTCGSYPQKVTRLRSSPRQPFA